jgi:predicted N-formylglutamate amidohydrolase
MFKGKQDVQAMKLVLTCEHALADIPEKYRYLFEKEYFVLETHEAYDPGAYDLFKDLKELGDYSDYQSIGRLLVETNRSLWHKSLFSRYTNDLSESDKNAILDSYYFPYRERVTGAIQKIINGGDTVLHFSLHSFTPVLHGIKRKADIGLLYDPQRKDEKEISHKFKLLLKERDPELKTRFNYPYLGKSDGLTTALRKLFPKNYAGIEIEVNQKWVVENIMDAKIKNLLRSYIKELKKSL